MAKIRKFRFVAIDIEYYGESTMSWWDKIFFNPPREVKGPLRNSKARTDAHFIAPYVFRGKEYKVVAVTGRIEKVTL